MSGPIKDDIAEAMQEAFEKPVNDLVQEFSIMRARILEHKRNNSFASSHDLKLWSCIND